MLGRVATDPAESAHDLTRWSEALAAIARTGLAFSDGSYDHERYEEILRIAGDMRAAVDDERRQGSRVASTWRAGVVRGSHGYVTPKVGVGAAVANEHGQLLLIQRSDVHEWTIPTGWADVGYSPSEVVAKEVLEECGLEVSVDRLFGVFDNHRNGHPIPHYTLLFACSVVGGELQGHPLECDDIGWFDRDSPPSPLYHDHVAIFDRFFDAIRDGNEHVWFDPPRDDVWHD